MSDTALVTAAQNAVIALGTLNTTLKQVLPVVQSTATSASAGTNGDVPAQVVGYLLITLPNGTPAKVPYYGI